MGATAKTKARYLHSGLLNRYQFFWTNAGTLYSGQTDLHKHTPVGKTDCWLDTPSSTLHRRFVVPCCVDQVRSYMLVMSTPAACVVRSAGFLPLLVLPLTDGGCSDRSWSAVKEASPHSDEAVCSQPISARLTSCLWVHQGCPN